MGYFFSFSMAWNALLYFTFSVLASVFHGPIRSSLGQINQIVLLSNIKEGIFQLSGG